MVAALPTWRERCASQREAMRRGADAAATREADAFERWTLCPCRITEDAWIDAICERDDAETLLAEWDAIPEDDEVGA